ncbi:hypothetical protein [Microcoleus sp.]|uniref:hypothetical protein n=1 Tax=Microcoleus sp. TaxID=44472 RepID=UPI003523B9B7
MVIGYWLLVIGYWLLVIGYWLFLCISCSIPPLGGVGGGCPMPDDQFPMPNARCPMPYDQFPMPNSQCPENI